LYVDLVQPVVATSDRHDAAAGSSPDVSAPRKRTGAPGRRPRPEVGAAAARDTSAAPAQAITGDTPVIDTSGSAPGGVDVRRPPEGPPAPRTPEAQTQAPGAAEPAAALPHPAPRPLAAEPLPAIAMPPDSSLRISTTESSTSASR